MSRIPASHTIPVLLALALIVLAQPGCESTDDSTAPPETQPPEAAGTVGAAGGTLTSADGRLRVTIPAGALGADTAIRVAEVDLAEIDPAFGDYAAHGVLEMEPADLALTAPAEIRYTLNAAPETTPAKEPPEYPLLLGIARTADGNRVPAQTVAYDLASATGQNCTLTFESTGWSQFVVGCPADPDGKDDNYGKLTFEAEFKLDADESTPLVQDRGSPFDYLLLFRGGGRVSLGNPVFQPVIGQWDFYSIMQGDDPWPPETVETQPNGRIQYRWVVNLIPGQPGDVDFTARLRAQLQVDDRTGLHLPLPPDAPVEGVQLDVQAKPTRQAVREPGPAELGLSIATGISAPQGLAVAFETLDDPAPLGTPTDPWLYVAGIEGVRYVRLVKNEQHAIVSAELVGAITGTNLVGVVPVSGQGSQMERGLFMHQEGGHHYFTTWNPAAGEYGMTQMHIISTEDATAYGSPTSTPGFAYAQQNRLGFLEFNAQLGVFAAPTSSVGYLFSNVFPDMDGQIVSCIVNDETRAVLAVTSAGQIWYHARQDTEAEGTLVGAAQSSPRKIRGVEAFFAISNSNSNTLTTFLWPGGATIGNVQHTAVGAGLVGIDVRRLSNSTFLVVSTSPGNNTYTLSQFNAAGFHVKSVTKNLPATGRTPRFAVFAGNENAFYVALSCYDTDTVETVPVDLREFL